MKNLKEYSKKHGVTYRTAWKRINKYHPSSKKCYICDCGNKIDRDLNASINIKTVGVHAVKQSVMDSTLPPEVKQAIPVELMNFL